MAATHTLPLASPGMARICLYGDLQRFGRRIDLRVKTGSEAIRALAMQIPAFRQKLSDGWYQVRIAGRDAGETELSARLNEPLANGAVIHIVPRLAGAKSGGVFQVVLGAALIAVAWWNPVGWLGAAAVSGMYAAGASMILGGVAQMLAPKARTPTDCYTLFRDAYHLAGIEMPDFHREDDWWRNGQNLYLDNLEATGLYQVPLSAAQPGDVLLCCFGSSVPNHAAIYCGDGELLHHIPEQLSKRERYTDKWQRRTHSLCHG